MGHLSYLYFDGQFSEDEEGCGRLFAQALVGTLKDLLAQCDLPSVLGSSAAPAYNHSVTLNLEQGCPLGKNPMAYPGWEDLRQDAAKGLLHKLRQRGGRKAPSSCSLDGDSDWEDEWAPSEDYECRDDASDASWMDYPGLGGGSGGNQAALSLPSDTEEGSWDAGSACSSVISTRSVPAWVPDWDELAEWYSLSEDESSMTLYFEEPFNKRQLRAIFRSLRRWHPRAYGSSQATSEKRCWQQAVQLHTHLQGPCHDKEALGEFLCQYVKAGCPDVQTPRAAAISGVAELQRRLPYLHAFEYCPRDPTGPRRQHLGQGDLLLTNGWGVFAIVEAKNQTGKSKQRGRMGRRKVFEQAQRYASQVHAYCPEAALVLPFTLTEAGGNLELLPVDQPCCGQLSGPRGYALLGEHADCFQ